MTDIRESLRREVASIVHRKDEREDWFTRSDAVIATVVANCAKVAERVVQDCLEGFDKDNDMMARAMGAQAARCAILGAFVDPLPTPERVR